MKTMQFSEGEMKMVYKLAWSFHRTTGIEWEDLVSEGFLAICESAHRYESDKGTSRSTYLYWCIRSQLCSYVKKNAPLQAIPPELEELREDEAPSAEEHILFKEELNSLSSPAKEIVKIIFEAPAKWLEYRPKMARGALRDFLRDTGWGYQNIWDGLREVDSFVKTRQRQEVMA